MNINELKERFKKTISLLSFSQFDGRNVLEYCLLAFKEGAELYDDLPKIEQCLTAIESKTADEVVKKFKIIDCILKIGRTEIFKTSDFKPVNLAKIGEETTPYTIQIAWVNLHDLEGNSTSNQAMRNILRDRLNDLLHELQVTYRTLENLSGCKE